MKKIKFLLIALILGTVVPTCLTSCKKGTDDPVISLKTRNDRITNTWELLKYEKNGTTQDLEGATYTYVIAKNGTLTRTVEGEIFGFPTKTESSGTWSFMNDDEDIKIDINNKATTYHIQRLATKELWLKEVVGNDTYTYYYDSN